MHPYNQAWLNFDKYSRESLTVADIKALEQDANDLIVKWQDEEDFCVYNLPQMQLDMMTQAGQRHPPNLMIQSLSFTYETLPGHRLMVDRQTINVQLRLG